MSFIIKENKEKEEKKDNSPRLDALKFEKIIQNIIEINKDKDIDKRKRNNSFSYLIMFKDKESFKNTNIQILKKKTPYKIHINVIPSLKYIIEYNEKDINKEVENLIKEKNKTSYDAKDEINYCDIKRRLFFGKRNTSSSKEKKSFCRNYILKSELYKMNKKTKTI